MTYDFKGPAWEFRRPQSYIINHQCRRRRAAAPSASKPPSIIPAVDAASGTGAVGEIGIGNVVNAPLPPLAGSEEFRQAMTGRILPALDRFRPDLILISAGFDAHWLDPLGSLNLDEADYAWITGELCRLAEPEHKRGCYGRMRSVLSNQLGDAAGRRAASAEIPAGDSVDWCNE